MLTIVDAGDVDDGEGDVGAGGGERRGRIGTLLGWRGSCRGSGSSLWQPPVVTFLWIWMWMLHRHYDHVYHVYLYQKNCSLIFGLTFGWYSSVYVSLMTVTVLVRVSVHA
jgi:hypothetical protein